MFRTRDFMLLFSVIVFLLVAIGTTLFRQSLPISGQTSAVNLVEAPEQDRTAVVLETSKIDREANLASLRRKIAEGEGLVAVTLVEEVAVDEVVDTNIVSNPEGIVSTTSLQICTGYALYDGYWSPQNISFELAEGARVVYRLIESVVGTSTVSGKEVLLQLPASPVFGGGHCLASDVIGIAQDGSLIKNDEVALYGVFGEHTLIGYALDGFPIYGVSGVSTDTCGGVVAAGEYRYYLSDDRETVLNCFSATPVVL